MSDNKQPLPVDYVLLQVLYDKAKKEPRFAVCAAFEAMSIVGGCWRGYGKFEPPSDLQDTSLVVAPLWAIDTLGAGWKEYTHRSPKGQSLGKALYLEGDRAGQHPVKEAWKHWFRDLLLARDFHELRDSGLTYDKSVVELATRRSVSESTVKRAWTNEGKAIKEANQSHGLPRT